MTKKEYSKIEKIITLIFYLCFGIGVICFFIYIFTRAEAVIYPGFIFSVIGVGLIFPRFYINEKIENWPKKYKIVSDYDGNIDFELLSTNEKDALFEALRYTHYRLVEDEETT